MDRFSTLQLYVRVFDSSSFTRAAMQFVGGSVKRSTKAGMYLMGALPLRSMPVGADGGDELFRPGPHDFRFVPEGEHKPLGLVVADPDYGDSFVDRWGNCTRRLRA